MGRKGERVEEREREVGIISRRKVKEKSETEIKAEKRGRESK